MVSYETIFMYKEQNFAFNFFTYYLSICCKVLKKKFVSAFNFIGMKFWSPQISNLPSELSFNAIFLRKSMLTERLAHACTYVCFLLMI